MPLSRDDIRLAIIQSGIVPLRTRHPASVVREEDLEDILTEWVGAINELTEAFFVEDFGGNRYVKEYQNKIRAKREKRNG